MHRIHSSNSNHNSAKPEQARVGEHLVHNTILLGLPKKECSTLIAPLEFVDLPVRTLLNEAGDQIKSAFFVNDGLASVLTMIDNGKSVEVGLCGKEGFVGIPLVAGLSTSPTRIIMQVAGNGFKISSKHLLAALAECPGKVSSDLVRKWRRSPRK
jgi:CRP-like cAMP-binding protein